MKFLSKNNTLFSITNYCEKSVLDIKNAHELKISSA